MNPQRPIWLYVLLFVMVTVIIGGCNPAKRVMDQQQQYEKLINDYLDKHPPKLDTVTITTPGGIDSIYVPIPTADTAAITRAKDSLQKALRQKYQQDNADCNRQVNEAFETGRRYTLDQISKQKIGKQRPDTITKILFNNSEITRLTNENISLKGQLLEARKKQSWIIPFIVSVVLNVLLLILLLKRK